MSHTPGPWRFLMEEDGDEETGGYGVDCWNGDIIAGAGGVAYEDVCRVWPRDEANGRLICAAPDLLVLAEELIPYLDLVSTERANKARAIVAKAKGETP